MRITARRVRDSGGRRPFCGDGFGGIFYDEARANPLVTKAFDLWNVDVEGREFHLGDLLSYGWGSLLAYHLYRKGYSLRLKVSAGTNGPVQMIETHQEEYRGYQGRIYHRKKRGI